MWGGRNVDGDVTTTTIEGPATEPSKITMTVRDLVSILTVVAGVMCGITGAAVLLGIGGVLLVIMFVAVPIGVLIGLSGGR